MGRRVVYVHSEANLFLLISPSLFTDLSYSPSALTLTGCLLKVEKNYEQSKSTLEGWGWWSPSNIIYYTSKIILV